MYTSERGPPKPSTPIARPIMPDPPSTRGPLRLPSLFLVIVLGVAWALVGGEEADGTDVFTALAELPKVLQAERILATELRHYVTEEQRRLKQLTRIADEFDAHSTESLADPEKLLGNPVAAFLVIKRFALDWYRIVDQHVVTNATEVFLMNVTIKTRDVLPDQRDLEGAVSALLRLQDTYSLTAATLASGRLKGVLDSPSMGAEDCFNLGSIAFHQRDYYHATIWLEESLRKEEEERTAKDLIEKERESRNETHHEKEEVERFKIVDRPALLGYLSYAVYMQRNVRRALNLTMQWLRIEPTNGQALTNKQYYEREIRNQEDLHGLQVSLEPVPNVRPREGARNSSFFINYERLCRGERTHRRPFERRLTCQYRSHHPSLYIRPALEEVINLRPRMVVYHNILSDNQVTRIKDMAFPKLFRSMVHDPNGLNNSSAQDYRISKSAWLNDSDDDVIRDISKKAAIVANLTLDTAEELQVLNYGIGGHYLPHYDFSQDHGVSEFGEAAGNRIATFLCYISDVASGGATVFPDIGVQLIPEKGACVLWYNLKKSGEGDMRTRHAACPVLTGLKWVANKWFHERGQEWTRPCGTAEGEYA